MALTPLNWRYVGAVTFTASSLVASHDAVFTLGTAGTYADGSARTPGAGSAWTWLREQASGTTIACYGNPPVNALAMRYIVGGKAGVTAYTFLAPDTLTQSNTVVYGMNRSSGNYTTWSSATPFTNAGFSGYWRGTRGFAAVAYSSVAMWESQEGCVIQYTRLSDGASSSIGFGALIDPLSADAMNAESDGRLYMMWGSGSALGTLVGWLGTVADGTAWGQGDVASGACHGGVFAPGTAVMVGGAGVQTKRFGNFSPSTAFISTNGDIVRVPMVITSTAGAFLGQSRQWFMVRDAQSRLTLMNGATVVGYVWGASPQTAADAIVLTY